MATFAFIAEAIGSAVTMLLLLIAGIVLLVRMAAKNHPEAARRVGKAGARVGVGIAARMIRRRFGG